MSLRVPEKQRQLDADRETMRQLAEQKQRDWETTRLKEHGKNASQSRSSEDDYRKRVEARIRKAKKRDET